jgi:predicted N-acetyltransferase YhbS
MVDVIVEPLARHPKLVSELAQLLNKEWGHLEPWSDIKRLENVLRSRCRCAAPMTLVALEGEHLAGSASIKLRELPHHHDKEYWVGDVIVANSQRGKGIGQLLVQAIVRHARVTGIASLYLYTPEYELYYKKLGWITVGRDPANGEDNAIMKYDSLP